MNLGIILYLYLIFNTGCFSKVEKIVGGENGDIKELSYMVSLRYAIINQHFCGGVIISKWYILTAAHCLIDEIYSNVLVIAGSNSSTNMLGSVFKIQEVFFHPQYQGEIINQPFHKHDIAVVKLRIFICFTESQKMIGLPTKDINNGDIAILSGWGLTTYPYSGSSDHLQKISIPILKHYECSRYYPFSIEKEQFCTYNERGIGACHGDSGSPLIHNEVLVGISSFIIPCAQGLPDIYTNIYMYLDFIRNFVTN